jgi:DUF2075 family protein
MWGINDLFGEPKEHQPMTLEEARLAVLSRAYEAEAIQLALSEMSSREKTILRNENHKKWDEAQSRFSELKSKYFREGGFEITSQSLIQARNEIWRENRDRLNMERGEFIEWVGDDDDILESNNEEGLET